MWFLVFINVMVSAGDVTQPVIDGHWQFNSFEQCIAAGYTLSEALTGVRGVFPVGTTAACVENIPQGFD